MSKTVMVSGGFDPLHSGHLFYLYNAAELGDKLYIIVNTNDFLIEKKGYYIFDIEERVLQLTMLSFPVPHYVFASKSKDNSVCEDLSFYRPDIFAKGGDRHPDGDPIPEEELCEKLGIKVIYGVGGYDKMVSSSDAVEKAFKRMEVLRGK